MKARNKYQEKIVELSHRLPAPTNKQMEYPLGKKEHVPGIFHDALHHRRFSGCPAFLLHQENPQRTGAGV